MSKIPTTFEMDGLFTQEDIDNRHRVMRRCTACNKWTEQNTQVTRDKPCQYCGSRSFDIRSTTSLRTWKPDTKKRRGSK